VVDGSQVTGRLRRLEDPVVFCRRHVLGVQREEEREEGVVA
jgi:hypothetical protein